MSALKKILWQGRYEVRSYLINQPATMLPLMRLKQHTRERMVHPETEIVIEGYPRCANTFAVVAFEQAQDRPISIAHHLHAPAQILYAADHNIPVILLIRPPEEAIPSMLVREPRLSLRQALSHYARFYETVASAVSHCVVAPFGEVTTNYGSIIERVNGKFSTGFRPFAHTEANVAACFAEIEARDRRDRGVADVTEATVSRPSQIRTADSASYKEQMLGDGYRPLLQCATAIYQRITQHN